MHRGRQHHHYRRDHGDDLKLAHFVDVGQHTDKYPDKKPDKKRRRESGKQRKRVRQHTFQSDPVDVRQADLGPHLAEPDDRCRSTDDGLRAEHTDDSVVTNRNKNHGECQCADRDENRNHEGG